MQKRNSLSTSTASQQRVARVPVEANNYTGLVAKNGHILYWRRSGVLLRAGRGYETLVRIYSLKDRKETMLLDDIAVGRSRATARRRWSAKVRTGCYGRNPDGRGIQEERTTSGLVADRVPSEEWAADLR